MRGLDDQAGQLSSHVDHVARARQDHPPRAIQSIVKAALASLASDFAVLYSKTGPPSITPTPMSNAKISARLLICTEISVH